MTQPDSLDAWLSTATRGLSDDAVQRIRAEITDHYAAAVASGATPDGAVRSFGDPHQSNRQYRRVYLTKIEAYIAGALANPKERLKQAIQGDLAYLLLVGWLGSRVGFSLQLLLGPLFLLSTPWYLFYPPNTKERCYNHLRILVGKLLCGVLWVAYYEGPTAGLVVVGAFVLPVSIEYWRWKVSRKLPHFPENIPVVPEASAMDLTPAPNLTKDEALRALTTAASLRWMALVVDILLFAGMLALFWYSNIAAQSPWTWAVAVLLCIDLPFRWFFPPDTEQRRRRYKRLGSIRWYAALAHLFFVSGSLTAPWMLGGIVRYVFDVLWILRRKLPNGDPRSLFPESLRHLTRRELVLLVRMQNPSPFCQGVEYSGKALALLILSPIAILMPLIAAAFLIAFALHLFGPLVIHTPQRGHTFRRAKWTVFGIAFLMPLFYGLTIDWTHWDTLNKVFIIVSLALYLFMIPVLLFERMRGSMRRKLPVEKWPRQLCA